MSSLLRKIKRTIRRNQTKADWRARRAWLKQQAALKKALEVKAPEEK